MLSKKFKLSQGDVLSFSFFILIASTYLYLAIKLMGGLDFNDETEKYIAAQLLTKGHKIYSEIFLQHGPTSYMLSHFFHLLFGFNGLAAPRAIPIGLSFLAVLSVMASPALTHLRYRFFAGSILISGLLATQAIFALVQAMYQVYAGYFFIVVFSIFLIPLIVGSKIRPWHAMVAGFSLAMIFFSAFSFALSILLICLICWFRWFLATDRKEIARLLIFGLVGVVLGTLLVVIWLLFYGSLLGYFVAHIYFNMTAYKFYLGGVSPWLALKILVPGWNYILYRDYPLYNQWFTHLMLGTPFFFAILIAWLSKIRNGLGVKRLSSYILLAMLVGTCFAYMNPRGSINFSTSTIVLGMCGVIAIVCSMAIESRKNSLDIPAVISSILLMVILSAFVLAQFTTKTWLYEMSPIGYYKQRGQLDAENSDEMKFVRSLVGPTEGILALPFELKYYVWAGRIPAFGIFYWMPWQQKYSIKPFGEFKFDICEKLLEAPPKVIYYTDLPIWENPTDTFLHCVKSTLNTRYLRSVKYNHLWVRADIATKNPSILSEMIVPKSLDSNSFSTSERLLLEDARIQLGNFGLISEDVCIKSSGISHALHTGTCTQTEDFSLGFLKDPQGFRVVAVGGMASQIGCVEITGASAENGAPARLWPCQDGARNQIFSLDRGLSNIKIRALHSNRCLASRDGALVQMDCNDAPEWEMK